MTTFQPGEFGFAEGWLVGGPLDGIGYSNVPIYSDCEPATQLVVPLDDYGTTRSYGVYQRRAVPWPDGRWFFDFVAVTDASGEIPEVRQFSSGDAAELPNGSKIYIPAPPTERPTGYESARAQEPSNHGLTTASGSFAPARRFLQAEWWWIASELARRNSALRVQSFPAMHHSADLQLRVRDMRDSRNVTFDTIGGVVVYRDDTVQRIPNSDLFTVASPHDIVKHIEMLQDWGGPTSATTPRSLANRVIAGVLSAKVNDRHTWTMGQLDMQDPTGFDEYVDAFGSLEKTLQAVFTHLCVVGFDDTEAPGIWVLRRNGIPVAVFVEDGTMFQRGKNRLDIMAMYEKHGRNFDMTLAHVLARVNQVPLERQKGHP